MAEVSFFSKIHSQRIEAIIVEALERFTKSSRVCMKCEAEIEDVLDPDQIRACARDILFHLGKLESEDR